MSDESSVPSNVVQFAPSQRRYPIEFRKPQSRAAPCDHTSLVLDAHMRTISCAGCGANLDPFQTFSELAADAAKAYRAKSELENITRELNLLQTQVERLKGQRKRARAALPMPVSALVREIEETRAHLKCIDDLRTSTSTVTQRVLTHHLTHARAHLDGLEELIAATPAEQTEQTEG